ncbi:avidin-related protein 1-like [Carettochelys insculpta]|uniref:avidin-related protein 1-like n=1 Tax=Carettochelys insculpta TaxID=44489 RepID=UPI003EBF5F1B
MGSVALCLLLALGLGALAASREKCVLSGAWRNDLGSNMTISAMDATGGFSGLYLTAVSATNATILESSLKGFQHMGQAQPTFGFTVTWNFSDSTTVFVGQCFVLPGGEEVLKIMWLLRELVDSPSNDWKATRVGTNTFIRQRVGDSTRHDGAW